MINGILAHVISNLEIKNGVNCADLNKNMSPPRQRESHYKVKTQEQNALK